MKRSKHLVIVLLVLNLVFNSMLSSASAAVPQDIEKHWAADTLRKWVDAGLIKGYLDGTFKPNAPVKRSEFVALLNRALKLSDASARVSFNDLTQDNWAYQEFAIAVKADYLKDTVNKVNPNQNTSRQEAAVMIAKALHLDTPAGGDVSQFRDASQIAVWSKSAIATLAAHNVFKGDAKGNMRPKADITRAEAVVAINAALGLQNKPDTVFDKAGVYGSTDKTETINGNVVIAVDGVTLQNTIINGDLTIAKEVRDGDVTLKKVTVKGTTHVNGGGENSVHIEDSVLLRIIVDKPSGKVRIVAIGATTVTDVIVNTSAKIEESNLTDSGFANIQLSSALPQGATVDLVGQFEDVRVMAANIKINIPSGSVSNLLVDESAANNTINVGTEAQVLKLILDAVAKLVGNGKIESATVNEKAKGSSFETKPNQVDGASKNDISLTPPTSGSTPSSNNGGNGNGNGDVCTADCSNATLSSLSVSSSVNDFELFQRNFDRVITGAGFSSDAFAYSLEVPRDFVESDTAFSVTAAEYATVSYDIQYDDGTYSWDTLTKGQTSFNVHLKPLHDASIYIYVNSGDKIHTKSYYIEVFYTRNLQEAFRIENRGYDTAHPQYSLVSRALEDGDQVVVTIGSNSITATNENGNTFMQLPNFTPAANLQGEFHVTVTRGDQQIMDGSYQYDLTPLNLVTDGSGIDVQLMTREELQDDDAHSTFPDRSSYGFKISFHPDKITSSDLLNAKFMSINWSDIWSADTAPRIWTNEDVKISYNKFGAIHSVSKINFEFPYLHYFLGRNEIYNQYVYVFVYDENKNIIGYYVYKANFDEDHVGEFVTILPPAPAIP
ncbi:S-layer homology domain-containing protein [Cohnella endophytica]|uniref:S-layer homology domain-containing protein n=1 Tax=Cohnella endophytica TaxID=2419778 RepID=A0A494XDD6_9BACL|nr:S-layer homology domain-containing protein [Cohnella endophytica]RKP47902.1 S-layer homology domain-containing protein [Cohnella endophytica]